MILQDGHNSETTSLSVLILHITHIFCDFFLNVWSNNITALQCYKYLKIKKKAKKKYIA